MRGGASHASTSCCLNPWRAAFWPRSRRGPHITYHAASVWAYRDSGGLCWGVVVSLVVHCKRTACSCGCRRCGGGCKRWAPQAIRPEEWLETAASENAAANNISHAFRSAKRFPNAGAIFHLLKQLRPSKRATFRRSTSRRRSHSHCFLCHTGTRQCQNKAKISYAAGASALFVFSFLALSRCPPHA